MKIEPENPVRLRECLTALSNAAGHDVTRVQMFADADTSIRFIVTCSRYEHEDQIAQACADALVGVLSQRDAESRELLESARLLLESWRDGGNPEQATDGWLLLHKRFGKKLP